MMHNHVLRVFSKRDFIVFSLHGFLRKLQNIIGHCHVETPPRRRASASERWRGHNAHFDRMLQKRLRLWNDMLVIAQNSSAASIMRSTLHMQPRVRIGKSSMCTSIGGYRRNVRSQLMSTQRMQTQPFRLGMSVATSCTRYLELRPLASAESHSYLHKQSLCGPSFIFPASNAKIPQLLCTFLHEWRHFVCPTTFWPTPPKICPPNAAKGLIMKTWWLSTTQYLVS